MKPLDITIGKYNFYCSGNGDYGLYSVYISKEGKLVMHQSWNKMPTEEQARMYLEAMNKAEDKK